MTTRAKAAVGAARADCPRCQRPTLRQQVGHAIALDVVTDAELMPYADAAALTGPNRLAWCAAPLHGGGTDLRWLYPAGADCPHGHVVDHRCPAGTPDRHRTEGAHPSETTYPTRTGPGAGRPQPLPRNHQTAPDPAERSTRQC